MKKILGLGLIAMSVASANVYALEAGEHRFNGFGTLGVTHMTGDSKDRDYGINGQTNNGWRGDELSRLGAQLSYGITDSVSVTAQLVARAEHDTWKVFPEWAYAAWKVNPDLTLRAGRLRDPVYMYSETLDIGFSYPWLRLPEEVYGMVQTKHYDGADVLYKMQTPLGSLDLMMGAGKSKHDYFVFDEDYTLKSGNLFAINGTLHTDSYGSFRLGYAEADISIHITEPVRMTVAPGLIMDIPITLSDINKEKGKYTSIGHQYDNGSQISAAEWAQLNIENDGKRDESSFYFMGGQRFATDYLGHVTYARANKDGGGKQESLTLGLNYSLNPTTIVKGEFKHVKTTGTEGYFVHTPSEVVAYRTGGLPLPNHKANIISVGVDFVF